MISVLVLMMMMNFRQEVDDGDYVDDFSAGTDDEFSAMVDDDDNDEAGNNRMDYSNTTIDEEGDFSGDQSLPSLSGSGSGSGAAIHIDNQEEEDELLMEEEEPLKTDTGSVTNDEDNTLSTVSTIIGNDDNDNDNDNGNVDEDILSHYSSDHNSHSDLQEEINNDDDDDGNDADDDDRSIPDSALDMDMDMENDEDLLMMMDDSDGDIFNVDIAVETDYPSFSDDSAACVDRMDLADAYDDEVLLTDNEAAADLEVEADAEADAEANIELAVESAAELAVEDAAEVSAESQIMLEEAGIADVNMAEPDIDVDVEEEEVYEYSEEEIAEIEESIPNISELVSDDKIAPSVVQRGTTVKYVITENMSHSELCDYRKYEKTFSAKARLQGRRSAEYETGCSSCART